MSQNIATLMPLILLIFIMYFLLIRPQKKREKAVNAMRNAIKVGDEVITIGGICGKIVKTKDETLTIQVGADKTKFEVMRWAISKVVNEEPAAPSKKGKKEEADDTEEAPKKSLPKKMLKKTVSAPDEETPVEENLVVENEAEEAEGQEEK
ncbi:preprotein translocase subunit YajC [Sinanaerobacter chloroacetimidivorans]|nr:preprotein translocase subunit YajC [Sinanaerobacter chloroacetimidivorans]